jgi:uncharacterized protein DUF3467
MAETNKPAPPAGMTFEIRPDVEGGVYSNVASIVHNMNEFMLDFAVLLPGKENATVRARVITNPVHAKQLLAALAENVANYERSYGEINVPVQPPVVKGTQTLH